MPKSDLPKLPINDALQRIVEILRISEEGENEETAITIALSFATEILADSIDRNVAFVNSLTGCDSFRPKDVGGLIGQAKTKVKQWQARVKILERILDRIETNLTAAVETSPVPLRGSEHDVLLQNGPPALRTIFDRASRNFSNIISPEMVAHHKVPTGYLIHTSIAQLDADLVKEDLKAGAKFEWAHLEHGKHLRLRLK